MRYFFVSYAHVDKSGANFGFGNCSFECGSYPNREELIKVLHTDREVSILSITELNEIDYNNFIRKS